MNDPRTRKHSVPFSMTGGRTASLSRLSGTKDWVAAANIHAVDGRVLWTVGEEAVTIYFREDEDSGEAPSTV